MKIRMKKNYVARMITLFLALSMLVAAVPSVSEAAALPISGTVYSQVIKKGKYVYCNTGQRIYQVNIKNGKKKLVADRDDYIDGALYNMRLKGSTVYYVLESGLTASHAHRSKYSKKKKKYVEEYISPGKYLYYDGYEYDYRDYSVSDFVIVGNTMYYNGWRWTNVDNYSVVDDSTTEVNMQVDLSTGAATESDCKAVPVVRKSNTKGYKVVKKGNYYYLKKTKGKKKTYRLHKYEHI